MVRDHERDKTLEHIWQQYQSNDENDPFTPAQGRGYTCHADHYYAQKFLRKEHKQSWEDAQRKQETAAAKAENMRDGTYNRAKKGHRVCMIAM